MAKSCLICGRTFKHKSNRQVYCKTCSPIVIKEQKKNSHKNRVRDYEHEAKYMKEVYLPRVLKKVQELGFNSTSQYTAALTAWANAVKDRDGICIECGSQFNLEAHHIIPKSINPSKTFEIKNGKTLCIYCHRTGLNAVHK